ncbi:MAG: metal ABC transporter permease [Deltaproteobacteria bacterium]|nr:metal ABC transporter permease [Deltaproteobacteria bacterium]MBW1951102.1 metal ABC transporter permease [Deltaproteobacteria bacterium]MBW2101911.1 metal ABC transporter permease [Deltaproteobacteria bacterium]MBW2349159.1 metal ABC transporter permease [Deltaproteobacteria bacterium]RLB34728.1 MAG: metal ABC transporter permease [Deltaproteobacteria bacterium]
MWEILHLEFMRNAVLAGILVSLCCGIIGSLVVVNRIVFISGGIAHAAYGGIGLAFLLGISPTLGAAGFAVVVALVMGLVSMRAKYRADTIIGVLWAVGMALGVVLIDLTPGYNVDLMSYLFGSILAVPSHELWYMLGLLSAVFLLIVFFYKEYLALSYDEEFAVIVGVPVRTLYLLLLCMTALCVVMVIRLVGLILVIALMTIPPYIAEKYTRSLGRMMCVASLLGVVFTLTGLWLSYLLDLTSGAMIILVAGVAFFASAAGDAFGAKRSGRGEV